MIMMDFMYGITGRSCVKSNSDSLNKSVDKSFYGFFAVLNLLVAIASSMLQSSWSMSERCSSRYIIGTESPITSGTD